MKKSLVLVIGCLFVLSLTSALPVAAQQSTPPDLVCPVNYTLQQPSYSQVLLRAGFGTSTVTENFSLGASANVVLTVWSSVGHPENGCNIGDGNDAGFPCDQNQQDEEFFIDVNGGQVAFVPDHGTDQWLMFGNVNVGALGAGTHSLTFRHSNESSQDTPESVTYLVGLCVETAPPPPPPPSQGCTPGYWKQDHHFDSWVGYSAGQTSVFNVPASLGLGNPTLLEALNFGGGPGATGGARILLRAAVAALLNAAQPGVSYPLSTADVIAQVNAALASNDRATMLALATQLDSYNNYGCPLN